MARDDDFENLDDPDRHEPGGQGSNGPSPFLVALVVVAVIAAAFVIQNQERAEIQYLVFFENEFRIWTAIAFAMVLGAVLDRLVIAWWRRSRRRN